MANNRDTTRQLLQELRKGYSREKEFAWEQACQHCGHRMRPLSPQFDFDELTIGFECSLCGKQNRTALEVWTRAGFMQSQ